MKNRIFSIVLICLFVVSGLCSGFSPVSAQVQSATDIDENTISFSVSIPIDQLSIEYLDVEEERYALLTLPGFELNADLGSPLLPTLSQSVGVPFNADYELHVRGINPKTIPLQAPVLPKATQVFVSEELKIPSPAEPPEYELRYIKDQEIYRTSTDLPGILGEVGNDGILRSQRILSVLLYPVQYNPATQEITVFEQLDIELVISPDFQSAPDEVLDEGEEFEGVFSGMLLNYDQAKKWRNSANVRNDVQEDSSKRPPTGPWTPPQNSLRIKVLTDGMYQITYAELVNAGMNVAGLDPRKLQMWYRGDEMAIKVLGEGDGRFDQTDKIIFYAEGETNNKYSQYNAYWLTIGSVNGKRMQTKNVEPAGAPPLAFHDTTQHLEENKFYLSLYEGNDDLERFRGDGFIGVAQKDTGTIIVGRWSRDFNLTDAYDGSGKLRVVMIGWSNPTTLSPHHHAVFTINGTVVGDLGWNGQYIPGETEVNIPAGVLIDGKNTLEITLPMDNQVDPADHSVEKRDAVMMDFFEVTAKSNLTAAASSFSFTARANGSKLMTITNLTGSADEGFDFTDIHNQIELENISISGNNVTFQDNIAGEQKYWVGDSPSFRAVSSMVSDTYSNLTAATNQADWIIISHSDFLSQAQTLANWRQNHGLNTMVVDLQDVYDEFGYGNDSVYAIREFLSHAYYHWAKPAPAYVVLMGDGHYDPKNILRQNRPMYIPPFLRNVDFRLKENSSDNSYVFLAGDDLLPEMMIGRLSVNTPAEAQTVVSKIIAYESDQNSNTWKRVVTDLADKADSAGNFPSLSYFLIRDELPAVYKDVNQSIYYQITHPDLPSTQAAILDAFNDGNLIFNFIGHASQSQYGNASFFNLGSLSQLNNTDKLSINVIMSCLEGYYIDARRPGQTNLIDSLAEQFVRYPNGGAVASWSSAGFAVATGHDHLNRGFFRAVFSNRVETIGEAVQSGLFRLWEYSRFQELLHLYHLFGDPAMKFQRTLLARPDSFSLEYNTQVVFSEAQLIQNDDNPENATLTLDLEAPPSNGILTDHGDGSWTYTPNQDFIGIDSIEYSLSNGVIRSNITTVYFRVKLHEIYLPLVLLE